MFCCFSHRGQPRKGSKSSSAGCKPSLVASPKSCVISHLLPLLLCLPLHFKTKIKAFLKLCLLFHTQLQNGWGTNAVWEAVGSFSPSSKQDNYSDTYIYKYFHLHLSHLLKSQCVNQFLNLPTKKHKKEMSKLLSTPITAPEMPRGSLHYRDPTECLASMFQALVSIFGTTKKQKLKCMSGFFPLPTPQLVKSSDNRNSFADYLRLMLVLTNSYCKIRYLILYFIWKLHLLLLGSGAHAFNSRIKQTEASGSLWIQG